MLPKWQIFLSCTLIPIFMAYVMVCTVRISGRPLDVYVKSSWFMSNFQNFVYNVQWGLCKIEIGL